MTHLVSGTAMRRAARFGALLGGVLLSGIGVLHAAGGGSARVKQELTATTVAPAARGKARFTMRSSKRGRFLVVAKHLDGGKPYQVIVGGVKVATMQTSSSGRGRASFSTQPGARDTLLGFDPRGDEVLLRDEEDGDDVLVGDLPDDDPAEVACCVTETEGDEVEVECEDLTAEECTAAGGTVQATDSCLPDPCATTPPEGGEEIICCTNETDDDGSEAECEDVGTAAECAGLGGTVVEAVSCDPNPCQVTPPTNQSACCVPEDDDGDGVPEEIECEIESAESCAAAGGTANGSSTCDPDPCNPG